MAESTWSSRATGPTMVGRSSEEGNGRSISEIYTPFAGCRVNAAVVQAIISTACAEVPSGEALFRTERDSEAGDCFSCEITWGEALTSEEASLLRQNPALVVKTHYALWCALYHQLDGWTLGMERVDLDIDDMCCAVGYAILGSHRAVSQRRQVATALSLLGKLEVEVCYKAPPGGSVLSHTGPVWDWRGQSDKALRVAPGAIFDECGWRHHNRHCGLVTPAFLSLRNRQDEMAILLGGYLIAVGSHWPYAPTRTAVQTLGAVMGITRVHRNLGRKHGHLGVALDRLAAIGVIGGWVQTCDSEFEITWPKALRAVGRIEELDIRIERENELWEGP